MKYILVKQNKTENQPQTAQMKRKLYDENTHFITFLLESFFCVPKPSDERKSFCILFSDMNENEKKPFCVMWCRVHSPTLIPSYSSRSPITHPPKNIYFIRCCSKFCSPKQSKQFDEMFSILFVPLSLSFSLIELTLRNLSW